MLSEIKTALRLTTDAYDAELMGLQQAAVMDLQIAGVLTNSMDALIRRAVITYCRMNFGSPEDYDRLKRSYDEQKAQLMMATGYTDWGDGVGEE